MENRCEAKSRLLRNVVLGRVRVEHLLLFHAGELVPQSSVDVGELQRFILDFSGKGEVRFRSFDLGTGRWIFAGIRSCVQ